METIINYPIEVSVCLIALYGLYALALKKETFFHFNRFYLLASVLLSLIIPLINFTIYPTVSDSGFFGVLQTVQISSATRMVAVNNLTNFQFVVFIYLVVVGLLFTRLLYRVLALVIMRNNCEIETKNGLIIAHCAENIAPFSFFKTVFVSEKVIDVPQLDKILLHEGIHVRQFHSIDVLIAEILCVFTWFNPFSWLLKSALKETHEYLADSGVSVQSQDNIGYFQLLIRTAIGLQPDLANNLNKSLILKRLKMMKKTRSRSLSLLKALPLIPLVAILFFVFSCNNASTHSKNETNVSTQDTTFTTAEKMPEYPGGFDALMKFMIDNVKYPEKAKTAGIEGQVFVSFVVTKSGKIDHVRVRRAVNDLLDAEAFRVVSSMPDWQPGENQGQKVDVEMTLPIKFKLE